MEVLVGFTAAVSNLALYIHTKRTVLTEAASGVG